MSVQTTGRLVVAGKSLEYRWWGPGPGDAPTLVMLHEGLGSVALWRDFPDRLAKATGWGVFAYSRAGYGFSDPDPLPWRLDYMTRHAEDVLPAVLDAIGFRKGAVLGHSDGASIALLHAGLVRDARVSAVVTIAPHLFTEPDGLAAIGVAKDQFETGDLRHRLGKYHANVDCAFYGWNNSWLHPGFKSWNIESALEGTDIPVLAVQGAADAYGTLDQISALQRNIPRTRSLILPDTGHAPHLESPDTVIAKVSEFLKSEL